MIRTNTSQTRIESLFSTFTDLTPDLDLSSAKKRFCGVNAVNEKRFNAFENLVADLAAYAENMAPPGTSACIFKYSF